MMTATMATTTMTPLLVLKTTINTQRGQTRGEMVEGTGERWKGGTSVMKPTPLTKLVGMGRKND
jgi:hypothetical protein